MSRSAWRLRYTGSLHSCSMMNSPSKVSYSELLEHTETSSDKLRAELALLSKASRRLWSRKIWPMTAKQGWGGGTEMGYRMPKPLADRWLELRSQAQFR